MTRSPGPKPAWWLLCLVGATLFIVWTGWRRGQRVAHVTGLAAWSTDAPAADASSPTGLALGRRRLVVPAHDNDSYARIAQVQRILAAGEWRLRHIDAENAPYGRPIHDSSAGRWWLAGLAVIEGLFSGAPTGLAVERAALFADPLLFVLGLAVATLFVRGAFGGAAAGLFAIGFAGLFPFAGAFLPGAPGDAGLQSLLALASLLPLLAGLAAADRGDAASARRRFAAGGAFGGLLLWTGVNVALPVLAGIALGGAAGILLSRPAGCGQSTAGPAGSCWRTWACTGAAVSLALFLIEELPDGFGTLELRSLHPIYAVAWLGVSELLAAVASAGRSPLARATHLVIGAVAVASLPAAMLWTGNPGFLFPDVASLRLTNLADGIDAASLAAWLSRDGLGVAAWATLLPLALLAPACWFILQRGATAPERAPLALALAPIAVAVAFACVHLRWWQVAGGLLLPLTALVTHLLHGAGRPALLRGWTAGATVLLLPGLWCLRPPATPGASLKLSDTEVRSLLERDLSWWLAQRTGPAGATVIAPPDLTASLIHHGGLRGVGTLAWENEAGMAAAVRILGATSPDESEALIAQRRVTHLVIPSWDPALDAYAGTGQGARAGTFLAALHDWAPPPWVRPVAFPLPESDLFAGLSVVVWEIVESQPEPLALGRIAEYFVETNQAGLAAAAARELARFPADIGALVARAYVAGAQQDRTEFGRATAALLPLLDRRADRYLEWDRRVALVAVLLQAGQRERAAAQLQRCLADADEARLQFLSPAALTRLLVVSRMLGQRLSDPALHALAVSLVPPAARARL